MVYSSGADSSGPDSSGVDSSGPVYVETAPGVKLALHCLAPGGMAPGGMASGGMAPAAPAQKLSQKPQGKPPILFVHATGFGARTYQPFTQQLAEHFTVWAPDLRAHGWSDPPADGDYLWTTFAQDILAIIDYLKIEHGQLRCVGHSVGAAVLLLAEAQRPGLIKSMYGYEPVIWRSSEVFERDENPLIPGALKRREVFPTRSQAMFRFASRPPFSTVRADALRSYVEDGFQDLADGTIRLRCSAADEADTYRGEYVSTTDQIADCEVPVVIGKGGDLTYGDVGLPAHEVLANSKLITYEGLGHFGPLQDPDRIAADAIAALG